MEEDIDIQTYFSLKSIIEIGNPNIIIFYYIHLPRGKLWDKIKNYFILKKIDSTFSIFKNNIEGIYLNKYIIFINKIEYSGGDIIDLCNNSLNINYDNSYENIRSILFKEITDYSFGEYFHLVKNTYFINIENNKDNLIYMNMHDIFNKITIYNLLIRYILTYNMIRNEISYNHFFHKNLSLINHIDTIYWINLESSIYRKNKMIHILSNFSIPNVRINAYDGSFEENIHLKYFHSDSSEYPKYTNKEYAILLSHLTTIEVSYQSYLNEKKQYGISLICEDDLSLDFINYWKYDIEHIVKNAPEDWEILMLGYFSLNINRKNLYEKWNNEWSAISYLVNHKNIEKKNTRFKNKWKMEMYKK
jgi:hypothetical protein